MDKITSASLILKRGLVLSLMIVLFASTALAFTPNQDGKDLILQAYKAYTSDMRNRPIVTDPQIKNYVDNIVRRLVPQGKNPAAGVTITVTILESPKPELYSYVDSHLIVTTGTLFAMDNEAQLAGVLAHEVANLVEGYHLQIYQAIKAAEKRQKFMATASALLGALLNVAVDYAVQVETAKETGRLFSGEHTYRETSRRLAAIGAGHSAYYSLKEVIDSIPPKDEKGDWIDPRLRFEPVADAQGMEYAALAGYDATETARGWENIQRINNKIALEQEKFLGPLAAQIREMQEIEKRRMRESLDTSGLIATLREVPPSRAEFVAKLTNLKEVKEASQAHGSNTGKNEYITFLKRVLLPRAQKAFEEEDYYRAHLDFQTLYDKGIRSASIAYGIAKSKLGNFAFGASEKEKREAEECYKEAVRLDPQYALPYKGLGELYEDWDRYGESAKAYEEYLRLAPNAPDRKSIERKINNLKRRESR